MDRSLIFTVNPDCGNSPKEKSIKELNLAFAKGDVTFLSKYVTDDIIWDIVGDKIIKGKEAFVKSFEEMKKNIVSELILDNIITHGAEAASFGKIIMQNGKKYSFADFYLFTSSGSKKIKYINSFIIEI